MEYGHEFLLAAKYEKFAITKLPSGRCGKTFSKEAGPSQNVLRKWAEKRKHPVVATNGLWRGGAHDYSGDKILSEGLKELEKFAKIAKDFPDQRFHFAIYCEHKLKTTQLKKVVLEQWKIVKDISNITLVNTPMSGGDLLSPGAFGLPLDRLLNEIHGTWNPAIEGFAPYMWACDGLPAQDCNIQLYKDRHANALIQWLWMQQYNCKLKVDDTTPISQRKVKPIEKQVTSLEYLVPNKQAVHFDDHSLYKSHADQHYSVPAAREQKPVIISNVNADKLEFVSGGEVIHVAKRTGNYTDGRPLYRATIWGYEIQKKALAGPVVEVNAVIKNKRVNLGSINPAFRENAWRDKSTLKLLNLVHKYEPDEEMIDEDVVSLDWV